MSNRGGKAHKHGLVGFIQPKSSFSKRRNKAKARARKEEAVQQFQSFVKGS